MSFEQISENSMLVNADFSRRAVMLPSGYHWVRSPQSGVERVMLDRVGGEQARATSIVRYEPGSYFPALNMGYPASYEGLFKLL